MLKRHRGRARSTAAVSPLKRQTGSLSRYQSALQSRWQGLPPRDQLALGLLLVFLLLLIGGYGGYSVHVAANESKADYQEHIADYFWLRAQAGNIDTNQAALNDPAIPPAAQITTLLNEAGITDAQVVTAGEGVQFAFSHDSQATISRAISQLKQQGFRLTTLAMEQDDTGRLTVQAVVS